MIKLKNFKPNEFDSPDLPGSFVNMDNEFLLKLQKAREIAGISFKINSGFRSIEKNKSVGGKAKSAHLVGKAVDIHCDSSRERAIILSSLMDAGFSRLGVGRTFIHADSDESKDQNVCWLY